MRRLVILSVLSVGLVAGAQGAQADPVDDLIETGRPAYETVDGLASGELCLDEYEQCSSPDPDPDPNETLLCVRVGGRGFVTVAIGSDCP